MLGGTSYGMAEESLAFYMLVIAALIALRYDALTGVAVIMLGGGIGVARLDRQPLRHRHRLRLRGHPARRGLVYRLVILVLVRCASASGSSCATPRACKRDPSASLVFHMKEDNERHFLKRESGDADVVVELTGQRKTHPEPVRPGVPDHDRTASSRGRTWASRSFRRSAGGSRS